MPTVITGSQEINNIVRDSEKFEITEFEITGNSKEGQNRKWSRDLPFSLRAVC